ncbi:MAG: hypothetical protein GC191_02575 [Azospirillum sp.]|nr:hypothetical protein [Azospirillum sp.]
MSVSGPTSGAKLPVPVILALPAPSAQGAVTTPEQEPGRQRAGTAVVRYQEPFDPARERRQSARLNAGQADGRSPALAGPRSGTARDSDGQRNNAGPGRVVDAGSGTSFQAHAFTQEGLGPGLTIEPWRSALAAYRRADQGTPPPPLVDILVG